MRDFESFSYNVYICLILGAKCEYFFVEMESERHLYYTHKIILFRYNVNVFNHNNRNAKKNQNKTESLNFKRASSDDHTHLRYFDSSFAVGKFTEDRMYLIS